MKTLKVILIAIIAGTILVACHSSKKSSTSAVASTTNISVPPTNFSVARSADGIYPPGNGELAAIQVKYKDVTLTQLEEGYALYTKGACINCHEAQSIYSYEEWKWIGIIDDMARKANISDTEKDAVTKYVLAIKATQAKESK